MIGCKALPERDYLLSILNYDESSGQLTWKVRPSQKDKVNSVAGSKSGSYIKISIKGRKYAAHRVAFFMAKGYCPDEIDHINGQKTDNRLKNLRDSNRSQNCLNKGVRSDSFCGVKGVTYRIDNKSWQARCTSKNGRRVHLGYFKKIEDAIAKLASFRKEEHGEFSNNG
ncbi:HNH endonuclease [Enterobacter hormaechei subsp. steigerwaltii]